MKLRSALLVTIALVATLVGGVVVGRVSGPSKIITVQVPVAVTPSPTPRVVAIIMGNDSREDAVARPGYVLWSFSFTARATCDLQFSQQFFDASAPIVSNQPYNARLVATYYVAPVKIVSGQAARASFAIGPLGSRDWGLGALAYTCVS
jgi:hypothetical protein